MTTCRLSSCCYIGHNGDFGREESQLHGFLLGWFCCLNVTECFRRAKLVFENKEHFTTHLCGQKLRETILMMSMVYALVMGCFCLVGLMHAPCWIDLDLFATEAKAVFGVGISTYTSSCALVTAKLYAILKDASRLRQNRKLKRTERYLYIYSFVSPVLYIAIALGGSVSNMDGQVLWQIISSLYLFETLLSLSLCLIVFKKIQDLAQQNAKVKQIWLTSLGSCGIGIIHFTLNMLVTSGVADLPEYVWDLSYLAQAYFLYFCLSPFDRALSPLTGPTKTSSSTSSSSLTSLGASGGGGSKRQQPTGCMSSMHNVLVEGSSGN